MEELLGARSVSFVEWMSAHRGTIAAIAAIVIVAIVVTLLARLLVRRFQRKLEGSPSVTQVLNLQRATTLTHALSATTIVVIWMLAVLLILDELTVNLAPLLASAGVAGVALGFGAQSVVRDTLSGFLILLENQYGVGDVIEMQTTANPVSGRIEALTLRVTSLRAFDGTLHIVPNGNIQVVSNKSKGWARAIVDVRVGYDQDVNEVRDVLDDLFDELRRDRSLQDWVRDGPSVLGIERMADIAQEIRITAETRPSKRLDVERLLRERIQRRLSERGIRVPVPTTSSGPADGVGR
ncbi:MAG: mechanosensitive ion channel family protein [Actinomycetota bacterium]